MKNSKRLYSMSPEEKGNKSMRFAIFFPLVIEMCDQAVELALNSDIQLKEMMCHSFKTPSRSALANQSDTKEKTDKSELDDIFSKVVKRINCEFSYEITSSLEIKLFQCNNCYLSSVSSDTMFCSEKHPCIDNFKIRCESCKKFINRAEDLKDHMMKYHHDDSILFLICDISKFPKKQPIRSQNKKNNQVLRVGDFNLINQNNAEKMDEDSGNNLDKTDVTFAKADTKNSQRTFRPHTICFKV